jgi:hypothetical protein
MNKNQKEDFSYVIRCTVENWDLQNLDPDKCNEFRPLSWYVFKFQETTGKLKAENLELCQDARAAKAYR